MRDRRHPTQELREDDLRPASQLLAIVRTLQAGQHGDNRRHDELMLWIRITTLLLAFILLILLWPRVASTLGLVQNKLDIPYLVASCSSTARACMYS